MTFIFLLFIFYKCFIRLLAHKTFIEFKLRFLNFNYGLPCPQQIVLSELFLKGTRLHLLNWHDFNRSHVQEKTTLQLNQREGRRYAGFEQIVQSVGQTCSIIVGYFYFVDVVPF